MCRVILNCYNLLTPILWIYRVRCLLMPHSLVFILLICYEELLNLPLPSHPPDYQKYQSEGSNAANDDASNLASSELIIIVIAVFLLWVMCLLIRAESVVITAFLRAVFVMTIFHWFIKII